MRDIELYCAHTKRVLYWYVNDPAVRRPSTLALHLALLSMFASVTYNRFGRKDSKRRGRKRQWLGGPLTLRAPTY
jgi:hypothetical protein